jgi:hypothetical protein
MARGIPAVDMGDILNIPPNSTLAPLHCDPHGNGARHCGQTNAGRGNAAVRSYGKRRAAIHLNQRGIEKTATITGCKVVVESFFSDQDFTAQYPANRCNKRVP